MRSNRSDEYKVFKRKIMQRFFGAALFSLIIVALLYWLVWQQRGGDWLVALFERFGGMDQNDAFLIYHRYFRGNKNIFFGGAVLLVFFVLLRFLFVGIVQYFNEINSGIDALLTENSAQIRLLPEMQPLEKKLNAVKQTLWQQKRDAQLAEQRKNELVMYLAHDIRTPLTSVIGYLNLLEESPDMTVEQKVKYVRITLEKAYRLEKMINEFFEITRYNTQQIQIQKEPIDLYYMLVQVIDEQTPALSAHGNGVVLKADENLSVYGDAEKLARVFNNILKNAAAYSYPDTEILVSAEKADGYIRIAFQNKGKTIHGDKLSVMFDKFFRLDAARTSDTGGTGLGLAIAKEIITLHDGTVSASSENETVTFTVCLPVIS